MKLVVHEVQEAGVWQELTTPAVKPTQVYAVRPHLYKHLAPAGGLKVLIEDQSGQLVAASEEIQISSITEEDYFHGYVRFYITAQLSPSTTYRFRIIGSSGYTYTDSAFIGVCNAFDLAKYEYDYEPNEGVSAALDIEIWSKEHR